MIDIVGIGLLYDFYESLLTERQRTVLGMYLNENLSLAEISEEINISRQGVHDIISRTASKLTEYEDKLRLSERMTVKREMTEDIIADIKSGNTERAILNIKRIAQD